MLSENLKTLRKQKGFTQNELASQLHVVRQTISKWERGLSIPDADALSRLSEIYDIDICELLGTISTPDNREDSITRELSRLNQQIAVRNQRFKTFWHILTVAGILIIIWGLAGIGFGIKNYTATANDPTYSAETAQMILSSCISAFTKGAFRTIIGLGITIISCIMNKNLT